ncbi:MAG: polysaccharide pyruvyl transferase family protein, partial [Bryobacteraceae bacterium]|nr:polysaccharide pyruvyl transferase family protein [Bryobacteraceae bacterium]
TSVQFGGEIPSKSTQFLVRGSTYLHGKMDFEQANKTLDSADCEGAIVGLGAQSPALDPTFLDGNEGARGFIARLNEKSKSISVRGEFTAEVVRRLGGKNIRVTGCPSLFHRRSVPKVAVPEVLATEDRSLGVSVHSHLGGIFCRDPKAARLAHSTVIYEAMRRSRIVQIFEQGVKSEYEIANRDVPLASRLDAAKKFADRIGFDADPRFFLTSFVTVNTVNEWVGKVRDLDAMVGFRFHGNMVALMQGRPCYYVVYDSRLEEFCKLYRLPYQDVSEELRVVKSLLDHDWSKTNSAVASCAAEMKSFWAENGFKHLIQ